MGQHFMRDKNILAKIVRTAKIEPGETVLEIGTGEGALTFELIKAGAEVIAVEKDPILALKLKEAVLKAGLKDPEIAAGDILKLPDAFFARISPYRVVANIPYYLTARLIRKLISEVSRPESIFITIQKEVAERITAKPPHMNLLALSVQAYGAPAMRFAIPKEAFWPKPKVESALLEIKDISDKRFKTRNADKKLFFALLRAGFRSKRKTLVNSLAKGLNLPKEKVRDILEASGIGPKSRAEELTLDQWFSLSTEAGKTGLESVIS